MEKPSRLKMTGGVTNLFKRAVREAQGSARWPAETVLESDNNPPIPSLTTIPPPQNSHATKTDGNPDQPAERLARPPSERSLRKKKEKFNDNVTPSAALISNSVDVEREVDTESKVTNAKRLSGERLKKKTDRTPGEKTRYTSQSSMSAEQLPSNAEAKRKTFKNAQRSLQRSTSSTEKVELPKKETSRKKPSPRSELSDDLSASSRIDNQLPNPESKTPARRGRKSREKSDGKNIGSTNADFQPLIKEQRPTELRAVVYPKSKSDAHHEISAADDNVGLPPPITPVSQTTIGQTSAINGNRPAQGRGRARGTIGAMKPGKQKGTTKNDVPLPNSNVTSNLVRQSSVLQEVKSPIEKDRENQILSVPSHMDDTIIFDDDNLPEAPEVCMLEKKRNKTSSTSKRPRVDLASFTSLPADVDQTALDTPPSSFARVTSKPPHSAEKYLQGGKTSYKKTGHRFSEDRPRQNRVSAIKAASITHSPSTSSVEGFNDSCSASIVESDSIVDVSESPKTDVPHGPFGQKLERMSSAEYRSAAKERFYDKFCGFTSSYADSHCHLDLTLWERHRWPGSFEKFRTEKAVGSFPPNFAGCIAVFAHPRHFEKQNSWEKVSMILQEEGVYGAIGCHPKCAAVGAWSEQLEATMRRLIAENRAVAVGECGLDYSQPQFAKEAEAQKQAFVAQMKMAIDLQLPLVVHCRDAEDECLQVMKDTMPHDHPIHRHCFTGNVEEMRRWHLAFPNLSFGFTPCVINNKQLTEVVKEVPLDKLLLETDAPYFLPSQARDMPGLNGCSHPGLCICVGKHMAWARSIGMEQLLSATYENTVKLYQVQFKKPREFF